MRICKKYAKNKKIIDKERVIMLIELSVKNFKSIKDEVVFSTIVKNKNCKIEENLLYNLGSGKDESLAKSFAIYGANGSGKSNFLEAISFLRFLVLSSKDFPSSNPIPVHTFRFDDKTINGNTSFEIKFIQNEYLYVYNIEFSENSIVNESLCRSPKNRYYSKTTKIFERKSDKSYNITASSRMQEKFIDEIGNNRSYLSVAGFKNDPDVIDAYTWFSQKLFVLGNRRISDSVEYSKKKLVALKSNTKEQKNFFNKIVNITAKADLGISSYNYKHIEIELPENIDENLKNFLINKHSIEINSIHNINGKNYELPLDSASVGTKKLFDFAGIMDDVEKESGIFIVDELDCSLHPELFKNLIVNFNKNFKNSQLIFVCHDTILLDTDIMLKNQIWFADKDKKTQATELYCLADFKGLRDSANIRNEYFKGVFGAYPNINYRDFISNE